MTLKESSEPPTKKIKQEYGTKQRFNGQRLIKFDDFSETPLLNVVMKGAEDTENQAFSSQQLTECAFQYGCPVSGNTVNRQMTGCLSFHQEPLVSYERYPMYTSYERMSDPEKTVYYSFIKTNSIPSMTLHSFSEQMLAAPESLSENKSNRTSISSNRSISSVSDLFLDENIFASQDTSFFSCSKFQIYTSTSNYFSDASSPLLILRKNEEFSHAELSSPIRTGKEEDKKNVMTCLYEVKPHQEKVQKSFVQSDNSNTVFDWMYHCIDDIDSPEKINQDELNRMLNEFSHDSS